MKKRFFSMMLSLSMLALTVCSASADNAEVSGCCDTDSILTFEEFIEQKNTDSEAELMASSDADDLSWDYSSVLNDIREAILDEDDYVSFGENVYEEDMYMIEYIMGNCFDWQVYLDYTVNSRGYVRNTDIIYGEDFDIDNAEEFYEEIDKILIVAELDMTELEKMLAVHDYMVLNYEYDYDNYLNGTIPRESYTANGIIINKTGVCQAYAEAYMTVMAMLDIPCQLVSSDPMNHAWNLVRLDGDWYHVDATWDDPVYDRIGRVRHEHFLFSDEGAADVEHYGWESDTTCDNTQYDNFFWKDVDARLININGDVYYITFDGITRRNGLYGEEEVTIYESWLWNGYGLEFCNGELYFLEDTSYYDQTVSEYIDEYSLYAMNLQTNDIREVELNIPEGKFTDGFYINGKDITYSLTDRETGQKSRKTEQLIDTIYVSSISLEVPENIYVGRIYNISSSVRPAYASNKELEWSVSDESVMTVTQDGEITALKEGMVTVTARATGGSNVYASSDIIVSQPARVPVADVTASMESGMVAKNTKISLATDTVGATIYYTTDGTEPTAESTVYEQPLEIAESTVVKAIALKEGRADGNICVFEYEVAVPESMTVAMTDCGYMVWNSGDKELSALKFNIDNSEGVQNVSAIMAVYENGEFVKAMSKDITADGSENEVVFTNMAMELEASKDYTVKVFVFGTDYPMFPFGKVNEFSINLP